MPRNRSVSMLYILYHVSLFFFFGAGIMFSYYYSFIIRLIVNKILYLLFDRWNFKDISPTFLSQLFSELLI